MVGIGSAIGSVVPLGAQRASWNIHTIDLRLISVVNLYPLIFATYCLPAIDQTVDNFLNQLC
jgi:hypothetical protein